MSSDSLILIYLIGFASVPIVVYLARNPWKSVSLPGAIWFTLQFYALLALLGGGGFAMLLVASSFGLSL